MAGHELDAERPDLVIVDEPARAQQLVEAPQGPPVLCLVEAAAVPSLPEGIEDFVVVPASAGELAHRVARIDHRARLAERQRLLSTAIEASPHAVEICDASSRLQYVNTAFTRILGYTLEEVRGRTPASVFRSDQHDAAYFRAIERALEAGQVWRGRLVSRARSGALVHFDAVITPVCIGGPGVSHYVAVKRDVTAQVRHDALLEQTNRALRHARDAALAASRTKSEFLANMSHELRTPLNAVIGYSELLLEDEDRSADPARTRDLRRIRHAGQHLLDMINDVLDLSRLEAGQLTAHVEPVDLRELVQVMVRQHAPAMRRSQNTMVTALAPDLAPVTTDRRLLRQILRNLLDNAGKFTERGIVTLTVAPLDRGVRFQVRDTGVGIDPSKLRDLFRPFTQVDPSTTRRYGGTGLGLALCDRLCRLLGGTIRVESELGEGSTFTVELPAAPAEEVTVPVATSAKTRRVLLIDDDADVQAEVVRILEPAGFAMTCTSLGEEGLAAARGAPPDVILLDLRLPDQDGWWVLGQLRVDADTADIPVVIVSALDTRELARDLGAEAALAKPFTPAALLATVRRCIHGRPAPFRVLVVEDDAPTRDVVCRTLQRAGFEVAEADNGCTGLSALQARDTDLVVMDLAMPQMDGFELLDTMRQHPALRDLPVLVATAKTLTEEERSRLDAQADGIIEKHALSRAELLQRIGEQVDALVTSRR